MAKGISNTSRTLSYIREQGWRAEKVEYWNSFSKTRKDLFGFIDIVAMGEGKIIAIQSCGSSFSAHDKKIREDERCGPLALNWMESGGRLILIGWRKVKLKRGGKAMRWEPRVKEYSVDDLK